MRCVPFSDTLARGNSGRGGGRIIAYAAGLVNSIFSTPPDFMPALRYVSVLERIQPCTDAQLHRRFGSARNPGKRADSKVVL